MLCDDNTTWCHCVIRVTHIKQRSTQHTVIYLGACVGSMRDPEDIMRINTSYYDIPGGICGINERPWGYNDDQHNILWYPWGACVGWTRDPEDIMNISTTYCDFSGDMWDQWDPEDIMMISTTYCNIPVGHVWGWTRDPEDIMNISTTYCDFPEGMCEGGQETLRT